MALERAMDVVASLDTKERYITLLERYLGYFEPLECLLAHSFASEEVSDRPRTVRLQQDLRALGIGESRLSDLPRCASLPTLSGKSEGMGCRYVVEGSALGGTLLYRLVRDRFGLTPDKGAAYFYGAGEETGRLWRDFGVTVERFAATATDAEREAALMTAAATFQSIHRWFCPDDSMAHDA